MAGEKIEVNVATLETEIGNLTTLLNEMNAAKLKHTEVDGAGYTKQYMDVVGKAFVGVISSLELLVNSTVTMLNDVKDGYIEIDEATRDSITEFKEEVLG